MPERPLKILVIGGMHGNEILGVNIVSLLKSRQITGVDILLANPVAVKADQRFVESDLNRSFGGQFKGTSETRRARLISQYTKPYDVVLDFHNTITPDNNCTFVGQNCDSRLYMVSKQLRLTNCIEATYDCINKYCLNVISIEISRGDKLDDAQYWYRQIKLLARNGLEDLRSPLKIYRFQRRVTWDEVRDKDIKDWKPFVELPSSDKEALNVDKAIVPIFIGSTLTEYYATLLSRERTI